MTNRFHLDNTFMHLINERNQMGSCLGPNYMINEQIDDSTLKQINYDLFNELTSALSYDNLDMAEKLLDGANHEFLYMLFNLNKLDFIEKLLDGGKFNFGALGNINKIFKNMLNCTNISNGFLSKLYNYVDHDYQNDMKDTFLMTVITNFSNGRLDMLLNDVDISLTDYEDNNCLMLSLRNKNIEAAHKILGYVDTLTKEEQSKVLNQKNYLGENCLNILCSSNIGDNSIISKLLSYVILDINNCRVGGDTPIITAIKQSNKYLFDKLINMHNLDINCLGYNGLTPLMEAILYIDVMQMGMHDAIYKGNVHKILEVNGLDINKKNKYEDSVLVMVFKRINGIYYDFKPYSPSNVNSGEFATFPDTFTTFITNISSTVSTSYKWNTLMFSKLLGRPDIDVNVQDISGNRLLHLSVSCGDKDSFCKLLKCKGININGTNDEDENCLLHYFNSKGSEEMCHGSHMNSGMAKPLKMLVGQSYNPTRKTVNTDMDGWLNSTIDSDALESRPQSWDIRGDVPLVPSTMEHVKVHSNNNNLDFYFDHLLSDPDFDINKQSYKGYALIHYLVINKHYDMLVKLVNSDNVKLNVQDCFGNTPLMYAVGTGITKYYKLLLLKGANKNLVNFSGQGAKDFTGNKEQYFVYCKIAGVPMEKVSMDSFTSANEDKTIRKGWFA